MPLIRDRAAFAEHASPEAVAAHLRKAEQAAARANAEVRWLTDLLAEKTKNTNSHPTNGDTHAHAAV